MLNSRERKALELLKLSLFKFEELGKLGSNVGEKTIQGLIEKGFVVEGKSDRNPSLDITGYAITEEGRSALRAEPQYLSPSS